MSDAETIPLEKIVALAKRRGFVFPTSEIYGGLANSYDYGPLGAELLLQIKNAWWSRFISRRQDMVGLDSQILQHPQTWVASGHVDSFNDPLVEDTVTHKRYRADHLIETWLELANKKMIEFHYKKTKDETLTEDELNKQGELGKILENTVVEDMDLAEMSQFLQKYDIKSPDGNPITEPKTFNLLFETSIGSVSGEKSVVYLRGETAQGIFTNFKQVLDSTRVKLPFGIGQMGKSFRNEITTGQFVFRTLEFEQAEIEYFFNPNQTDWKQLFQEWQDAMWAFVTEDLGINPDNLRWRQHTDKERSFYSLDTWDLEYKFPFGWKELWGIAYRTDYDLKQHIKHSGQNLEYRDPQSGEVFVPHVIEPAVGINRLFLMMLVDTYNQDQEKQRTVLSIPSKLAPYQVAVFPLLKNKPELVEKAQAVFDQLLDSNLNLRLTWDDRGNIGKRYLYQDEIGTPFCITIDFETLEDQSVTIRHRDTAEQERIALNQLEQYLSGMLH